MRKPGKRLGRIAAAHRDHIGGDHQGGREQKPGHDAGGEQIGDRDRAARRDRIDDHVVRGRDQQRDDRRIRRDVDA